MKKSLFLMAAASALMLTACTSESDVLQSATKQEAPKAVGFDVFTQNVTNVTRAGMEGTMTTGRMQRSEAQGGGFGVYAFLTEDELGGAGDAAANATAYEPASPLTGVGATTNVPNFMANEKILWNSTNLGWYYSPLKYWPNETDKDSQSTPASMEGSTPVHLDRLTFFAYAPYVSGNDGGGTGIIYITDKDGLLNGANTSDPTIAWKATANVAKWNPNEGVDLLWGVAPSGGLSYTAVNGWTVTRNEGTPLLNMIKPNVNTSMKFLFQHALARFGINVVAAVDQVSPGGKLDPNTKITINSLKITGAFGTTGELNLNNDGHPSVANWTKINSTPITSTTADLDNTTSITVIANDATATNNHIAENLRWKADASKPHEVPVAQTVVGVTPAKQDLLAPSTKWFNKLASAPAYNPGKKYYTDEGTTEAVAKAANYSKAQIDGKWGYFYTESAGVYTRQSSAMNAPAYPGLPELYFVKATAHTVTTAGTKPATIAGNPKIYQIDNATYDGSTEDKAPTYTNNATYSGGTWGGAAVNDVVYTLEPVNISYSELPYKYAAGDYYEAERNYLYVVPTNAALDENFGNVTTNADKLRTITVQIEYYINTKDDKLAAGFAETKNVITKQVILPSLANGKSYNLNLILGLTSVKIEAEVDDWKVENVQADLPQNTAD